MHLLLFCKIFFDATTVIRLQKRNNANAAHTLTSCFFWIFPSYFSIKILGACPLSFPLTYSPKFLFREYLPYLVLVIPARQQIKLHHPALYHLQTTMQNLTRRLFRSQVTMAHAYQQCTETRRAPGGLFWTTAPNSFSRKLLTCQEKYLRCHPIKLLMS